MGEGFLAGFFVVMALSRCYPARTEDSHNGRSLNKTYHRQFGRRRVADNDLAVRSHRVAKIIEDPGEKVEEDPGGFLEGDAVLGQVGLGIPRIPTRKSDPFRVLRTTIRSARCGRSNGS